MSDVRPAFHAVLSRRRIMRAAIEESFPETGLTPVSGFLQPIGAPVAFGNP